MAEERAPGAEFCFASTLHDDVEVGGERGEERQNRGQQGVFWGRMRIYFLVEDLVEEDLEGVREVCEGCVVVGEVEGGRVVVHSEVVSEERGEEEVRAGCEAEVREGGVAALDEVAFDAEDDGFVEETCERVEVDGYRDGGWELSAELCARGSQDILDIDPDFYVVAVEEPQAVAQIVAMHTVDRQPCRWARR